MQQACDEQKPSIQNTHLNLQCLAAQPGGNKPGSPIIQVEVPAEDQGQIMNEIVSSCKPKG